MESRKSSKARKTQKVSAWRIVARARRDAFIAARMARGEAKKTADELSDIFGDLKMGGRHRKTRRRK
jgi:hypothetical protein